MKEDPEKKKIRNAKWRASHPGYSAAWFRAHPDYTKTRKKKKHRCDEPKEKKRTRARSWRTANIEKVRTYNRAWCLANPDRVKAHAAKKYQKHAAKIKAKSAAWYAANLSDAKASAKKWKQANPEKKKALDHKRRALERRAVGCFTAADLVVKFASQNGLCAYCKRPLPENNSGVPFGARRHVEHRIPLSRGGTNYPENIVWACGACNSRKHNQTDVEFLSRATLSRGNLCPLPPRV